jgi:hypothetical protein
MASTASSDRAGGPYELPGTKLTSYAFASATPLQSNYRLSLAHKLLSSIVRVLWASARNRPGTFEGRFLESERQTKHGFCSVAQEHPIEINLDQ